ncbi:MAG: T9SS type A sorting domain-containing protein [Bacteroidota bacterium]
MKLSNVPKQHTSLKLRLRFMLVCLSLLILTGVLALGSQFYMSSILATFSIETANDFDGDGIDDEFDLDDDNDGIPDLDEGYLACVSSPFTNGDFEEGPYPSSYTQTNEDNVNGWETSAPDNKIEVWHTGFLSVPSQSGSYHVEINSSHHAALFQTFCTRPGAQISWSIWHRGRAGTDVAIVRMGNDLISATVQATMTTGNTAWAQYSGTYTVPPGQTVTYFICESVSTGGGSITVGNFIDNMTVVETLSADTDLDGLADQMDLDADNDGISDILEAGGTDADGNGIADNLTDTDGDGLVDLFDNDNTDGPLVSGCTLGTDCDLSNSTSSLLDTNGDGIQDEFFDSDGDGIANFRDIDADGDGIVDNTEAQSSAGYVLPTGYDDDEDGIDNAYDVDCSGVCTNADGTTMDVAGTLIVPVNTDATDTPDYLDLDSDNDGESDQIEAFDTDDNGVANTLASGTDTDGDGLDDAFDGTILSATPVTNPYNTNQSPISFPNDDPGQAGGEPDWRESSNTFPVEWLSFDVTQSGTDAIVEWTTASETNSDYFDIERSVDGVMFSSLGSEPAMGSTQDISSYRFVDPSLGSATAPKLIYRLKQVDLDGTFSYSSLVEMSFHRLQPGVALALAPNPAQNRVAVQYTQTTEETLGMAIFSIHGKKVYQGVISGLSGEVPLEVSSWPSGTYMVTVDTPEPTVKKLIVQH